MPVAWHEYPMQHSVVDKELRDIEAWLTNRIEEIGTRTED